MRVVVYKCRFTGKIFEHKDRRKYITHLKKVREDLSEKRKIERTKKTFKAWLDKEKENIHYPGEIPEWFMKNQRTIMDGANAGFGDRWRSEKFYKSDEFTKVKFESVRYDPYASNTHVHPEGGVTNWSGKDKDAPIGYRGWVGNVSGVLKRHNAHKGQYPYGNALNAVGIKTGSGGGGNENWGYGFTIFLDDWPGLGVGLTIDTVKGVK